MSNHNAKQHLHERKHGQKNETEESEFERESIVENPNFTGIRKQLRQSLLPYVKSGIHTVVKVQSTRSARKTQFYEFVSITGTHNFMIGFFPILFFVLGNYRVGLAFTTLIGLGIYIGNVLKDYLCLPRPIPPSLRLSFNGTKEFGFPSTHSITAFNMPMYVLLLTAPFGSQWFFAGFLAALVYTYLISYSRVYLGLHCVTDIVGGIIIASVLIILWQPLGVSDLLYDWVVNSPYYYVIPISVIGGIVLLTLHPEPVAYCPCFEDSACFVGSCVGIMCTLSIPGVPDVQLKNFSVVHGVVRYVLGVSFMLATRFLLKPSMYKILPWFYDVFHFHGRRFLPHLGRKDDVNLQDVLKPVPSLTQLNTRDKKPPHDVDIPSKYIVYTAMTFVGIGLGLKVIDFVGLA